MGMWKPRSRSTGSMRTEESKRDLESRDAGHAVEVGGWIVDGADAVAERLEEEGEIAVAAADIEHRVRAEHGVEERGGAGEHLVEQGEGAETVPRIPAGVGDGDFALAAAQGFLEGDGARDQVADFELLDERASGRRRRFQDAMKGHFNYYCDSFRRRGGNTVQ